MIELKRCPFCGGKAKFNLFCGNYCITCTNCSGAIFPARGMSRRDAAENWNKRTQKGGSDVDEP